MLANFNVQFKSIQLKLNPFDDEDDNDKKPKIQIINNKNSKIDVIAKTQWLRKPLIHIKGRATPFLSRCLIKFSALPARKKINTNFLTEMSKIKDQIYRKYTNEGRLFVCSCFPILSNI